MFWSGAVIREDEEKDYGFIVSCDMWMYNGECHKRNNKMDDKDKTEEEKAKNVKSFYCSASNPKDFDLWGLVLHTALHPPPDTKNKRLSQLMIDTVNQIEEEQEKHRKRLAATEMIHGSIDETPVLPDQKAIDTLTPQEREEMEEKFMDAIDKKEPTIILPSTLLYIQKSHKGKFGTADWKKRWVTLTDDVLSFRQTKLDLKNWKRANESLSLAIGKPVVSLGTYDEKAKLSLFTVEVDIWAKHDVINWSRRKFVLGTTTLPEAKLWMDHIQKIITENIPVVQQAKSRKKNTFQRSATWNLFKMGSQRGLFNEDALTRMSSMRAPSEINTGPTRHPSTSPSLGGRPFPTSPVSLNRLSSGQQGNSTMPASLRRPSILNAAELATQESKLVEAAFTDAMSKIITAASACFASCCCLLCIHSHFAFLFSYCPNVLFHYRIYSPQHYCRTI